LFTQSITLLTFFRLPAETLRTFNFVPREPLQIMLAPLDNEIVFKKAFTNKTVFRNFIKDILGLTVDIEKIETEKHFVPKIGNIDFAYDIFAETTDHRIIIEIQKVDYDYNFDRFLHCHMMAVAELQRNAKDYKIDQTVYTIVVLTAPYKIKQKTGEPVKDDVLISSLDPRTLQDEVRKLYGHKLLFLNPDFRKDDTPKNYLDWLDLVYESIHHPENFHVNLNNKGVKKAVAIIDYDKMTPVEIRDMKINEGRKATLKIYQEEAEEAKQRVNEEKKRADNAEQRIGEEKKRADKEKKRADEEKKHTDEEKKRADAAEELLKQLQEKLNSLEKG